MKKQFILLQKRLSEVAGVGHELVRFEDQRENGKYLWIASKDNNEDGVYIEVKGYSEACKYVEGMIWQAGLDRSGKIGNSVV